MGPDPSFRHWPNRMTFFRTILPLAFVAVCFCVHARAQDHIFNFEPEHCAENDDHLHVRLRTGFGFRFPVGDIMWLNWGGNAISGADESSRAPIGCAQNPAVLDSLRLRISPDWDDAVPANTWRPIRTTVSRYEGTYKSHQLYHKIATENIARFVHLNDDLEIFRGKPVEGHGPRDGSAFIRAKPGRYPLSLGMPFVILCLPAIRKGIGKNCRAGYGLEEGLYVGYQFWGQRYVPEVETLELDRNIRRYLKVHCVGERTCSAIKYGGE